MLRKSVALIMIVVCTLVCLPVFSSASQNISQYASIPRPVPSDNVKFIVTQNSEQSDGFVYMISIPAFASGSDIIFQAVPLSYNKLSVYCFSLDIEFDLFIMCFDLNGNFVYSFEHHIGDMIDYPTPFVEFYSPYYSYFDLFDIPVSDPDKLYSWGSPSIVWNDATDPAVYTNWLNQIYSKLGEIDINTDNIESQLTFISSQLTLFYNLFNSYQMQQHSDLINIYNKIIDIYNLLSEEQETYAPVEQGSQIDQFIQAESALNKDFSGDLQNQFNTAGNIFSGNSAFAFISNTFQDLILSNISLNSLIIFALAVGLCVLVLGRRLNA